MTAAETKFGCVKLTINLRDGTKHELKESVANGSGDAVDLNSVSQALQKMQERTNKELTLLVEKEKNSKSAGNENNNVNNAKEEEDGSDEDDDDTDEEPPKKQQRR